MAIYTHYEVANSPFFDWHYAMGDVDTFNSTLITFVNSDGTLTKAHGNFVVLNGSLLGGVINSLDRTSANGQTVYESITGVSADVVSFLAEFPQGRLSTLLGGDDQFYGYSGYDILYGGSGKDLLVGGAGDDELSGIDGEADQMMGGQGDDTYRVDPLDTIKERLGEGIDTLVADGGSGTYQVPDNVENVRSMGGPGSVHVHVIGNGLDNTFKSNRFDSILE